MTSKLHALAIGLCGCTIITQPGGGSSTSPHAQPAAEPEATAATPPAAPVADANACPSDLAMDRGATTIATIDAEAGKRPKRAAPGHKQKLGKSFGLAQDDAVARVIAIEAKHPTLIPAGFRDAALASPRDAKECRKRTGTDDLQSCEAHCDTLGNPAGCQTKCEAFCERTY